MTAHEAAKALGITINSLANLVWRKHLTPASGTGIRSWTFTAEAVEQRIRDRDAGINRRRAWNGCAAR